MRDGPGERLLRPQDRQAVQRRPHRAGEHPRVLLRMPSGVLCRPHLAHDGLERGDRLAAIVRIFAVEQLGPEHQAEQLCVLDGELDVRPASGARTRDRPGARRKLGSGPLDRFRERAEAARRHFRQQVGESAKMAQRRGVRDPGSPRDLAQRELLGPLALEDLERSLDEALGEGLRCVACLGHASSVNQSVYSVNMVARPVSPGPRTPSRAPGRPRPPASLPRSGSPGSRRSRTRSAAGAARRSRRPRRSRAGRAPCPSRRSRR